MKANASPVQKRSDILPALIVFYKDCDKHYLITEMRRPEGSLFLLTALLYLPVSAAIFPAAAPKQEDRKVRLRDGIVGAVVSALKVALQQYVHTLPDFCLSCGYKCKTYCVTTLSNGT